MLSKPGESLKVLHSRPFAYKKSTDVRPVLCYYAYRARDLMNCTVASFYEISDGQLTPQQLRAKREFIAVFERHAKRQTKNLHATDLYNVMNKLMELLDTFFFFGSVTHLVHWLVLTVFPPWDLKLGLCEELATKIIPKFDISIHRKRGSRLATLAELVDTLLHEMTHTFLMAFTCCCPKCLRNDHNALSQGTTGHGPTFCGLSYAAMRCLGQWNPALDEVFMDRSGGTYIDGPSLANQLRIAEETRQKDRSEGKNMLPYIKNPSPRLLIWNQEDKVIIDVERLRAHVKRTAMTPIDSAWITTSVLASGGSVHGSESNTRSSSPAME
ncbi:hypothetical protein F5B22DRAFT_649323 [Xylaria bambusicola]|uniref:uncharacterized protein n=1 Tax=Xylaria bambusicola TaxID=326684 RepID=UPI002008247E|nr:uncharacterized protein F5B22DRAFT_649323 [Xylaria bambusicola]KAI0509048.1 hypothetical protein F5B22DRAFT_649323 [Xylaria bambusicola]